MATAKYFLVLYLFAQFAAFLFNFFPFCVCEVHAEDKKGGHVRGEALALQSDLAALSVAAKT